MKNQPSYLFQILLLFASSLFYVGCETNDNIKTLVDSEIITQDQNVLDNIAFVLSKSLEDQTIREFIKNEASKQFDSDYDVMYQMVKDKRLSNGKLFKEALAEYSNSREDFFRDIEKYPLLTILVPELSIFSNNTWETLTQIPAVVVRPVGFNVKDDAMVSGYDPLGNRISIDATVEPDFPLLVLKENDRVVLSHGNESSMRLGESNIENLVHTNEKGRFYFLHKSFDPKSHEQLSSARTVSIANANFDQRVLSAFQAGVASDRDYVYYDILPPNRNSGEFNPAYVEHITSFKVNSTGSHGFLVDEQLRDITDGMLDFQIDVFFAGELQGDNLTKVFSVSRQQLFKYNQSGQVIGTKQYDFSYPIAITSWDFKVYGNRWKFIVSEIDPGTTQTQTTSIKSTFGTNFSFDTTLEIFIKIGAKFGASYTVEKTQNVSYSVTGNSDNLGSGELLFDRPIIVSLSPGPPTPSYTTWDVTTGTVSFSVEPIRVY